MVIALMHSSVLADGLHIASQATQTRPSDNLERIQLTEDERDMNALLNAVARIFLPDKTLQGIITLGNIRRLTLLADKYDLTQVLHQVLLSWPQNG
jgi:hypothetical protein